jgi:hypothetical protein
MKGEKVFNWRHYPVKKMWKCMNMQVRQITERKFICELLFRGKVIYAQSCFGDKRSAIQKCTRARDFLAKKCTETPKD